MAILGELTFEICNDNDLWDELVESSNESSAFLKSSFLRSIEDQETRWLLRENQIPVAGTCILFSGDLVGNNHHAFCLYQGAFFPNLGNESYTTDNERMRRFALLIEVLETFQQDIKLSLHPFLKDTRAVDWFYYGRANAFLVPTIEIRHTGLVHLSMYSSFEIYLNSIRNTRRREFKSSLKSGDTVIRNSQDVLSLAELYAKTFKKQDIGVSTFVDNRLKTITKRAVSEGTGELSFLISEAGVVVSSLFVLHGRETDYALIGASDPNYYKNFGATRLILTAIQSSIERGISHFDFCGMNSPERGEYKSSFNARVTPYFEITLQKKYEVKDSP